MKKIFNFLLRVYISLCVAIITAILFLWILGELTITYTPG